MRIANERESRSSARVSRATRGQSLLETVLMVPILLVVISGIMDLGHFAVVNSNVERAADSIARQYEATPDMTSVQLNEYLSATFPELAGATVSVSAPVRETETVDYKVYDASSSTFKVRPSTAARDISTVTVRYESVWFSPVLMAAAGRDYQVEKTAAASIDKTMDVW